VNAVSRKIVDPGQRMKDFMVTSLLNEFKGKGYKTQLLNPLDMYWEWRLGVQTFGFHPGSGAPGDPDWQVHYATTAYKEIFRLLKCAALNNNDVFLDLGSGMGRATFAASWLGAKRAIGVDIVPELWVQSNRNLQRSVLRQRNIQFICMNAADYYNKDVSVIFMCHPFGAGTLRQVLENIGSQRTPQSKRLRIIYRNPVCESVLKETAWLKCVGNVADRSPWISTLSRYHSSIWESTDHSE
jgi:16S rRNA G966 N2-methylase RsmD